MTEELRPGLRREWTRLITADDVRRFGEVSGDQGRHHVEPDAQGRVLAQGLLTASLPTKLGGDLHYIARTMTFDFLRPVYSGDRLKCWAVVETVVEQSTRYKLTFRFEVENQDGAVVLKGRTAGQILKAD